MGLSWQALGPLGDLLRSLQILLGPLENLLEIPLGSRGPLGGLGGVHVSAQVPWGQRRGALDGSCLSRASRQFVEERFEVGLLPRDADLRCATLEALEGDQRPPFVGPVMVIRSPS